MAFDNVSSKNGKRRPRESGFMFMIRLLIVAVLFRARFPYFWLKLSLLDEREQVILLLEFVAGKKMFCYALCIFPDPVSTLGLQI